MKVKPHVFLFSLLILLLPSQLGKHFWFDFSLVRGVRIDYLSPTLYVTDILTIGVLMSWWWHRKKIKDQRSKIKTKAQSAKLLFVIIFIAINIFFSSNPFLTIYKWLKFFEFTLLAFYVYKNSKLLGYWLFSITLLYSSFLALSQFFFQHSIGGLWWFLGERTFTSTTPGIAQIIIGGKLFLRPYATFSHPNQLAGYILIVLTLLTSARRGLAESMLIVLGCLVLILTFSKAVLLTGFLIILLHSFFKRKKKNIVLSPGFIFVSTVFIGLLGIWAVDILPFQSESFTLRALLTSASLGMTLSSPVWGVGLGNFIPQVSAFISPLTNVAILQPVHNIYLLIAAETGLAGLGFFLWFLLKIFNNSNLKPQTSNLTVYHLALVAILIIGLFDHYFVTLQQTQLLTAIVVGMALRKN